MLMFVALSALGLVFVYAITIHDRIPIAGLTPFVQSKLSVDHKVILYALSFYFFIAAWHSLAVIEDSAINKIPTPFETIAAATRLTLKGTLLREAWTSCIRILIGFCMAAVIGVSTGLLAGSFHIANRLVLPVNSFLRYIPPTSFVSLLIVYFGVGESYKYAVIFLGVIFFIIQMVVDVVEDIDKSYFEMAKTMGLGDSEIFRKVIVPASWPRIVDVLRINLSAAWTFLVIAEIIGSTEGLGHLIAVSQRFLRIDELYVAILAFGFVGVITDRAIEITSRKMFRWHYISV